MAERDLSRHERAPRGGADTWDAGPAGTLLTAEFFGVAAPTGLTAALSASASLSAELTAVQSLTASLTATATLAAELFTPRALRIDALGDALKLATPQSSPTSITMLGWVKLGVDRNDYSCVFGIENAALTQWNELITDADGTTLAVYDHGARQATVGTLVVGTWHKVALVITSGAFAAYFGTAGTPGVSKVTGSISNLSLAPAAQHVGSTGVDEWLNGAFSGVRVWDAALSDAEVAAEFTAETAVRTANLYSDRLPRTITAGTELSAGAGVALADGPGAGSPAYTLEAAPILDAAGGGGAVLDAALTGSATLSPTLTTAIRPTAALTGSAATSASLTTAIRPTAALAGAATLAAELTTGTAPMTAALTGSASLAAQLTTAIALTSAPSATAALAAQLTTAIRPTAALSSSATVSASLTTAIPLAAGLSGTATSSATLTTAIRPTAALTGSSTLTAALTTAIALGAPLDARATLAAELSTAIRLSAGVTSSVTLSAELALVLVVPHYASPGEVVTVTVASEPHRVEVLPRRASVLVVSSPATAQAATPVVGVTTS